MADLQLAVRLIAGATTIELEQDPYSLHSDTRTNAQVSLRKHEASGPYVEGSITVSAVRENVTETVAIWVQEDTPLLLGQAVRALEALLIKSTFTLQWDWVGSARENWTCFASSYVIESSQPLMVAKQALVRASVPRLPTATIGALP